MQGKNRQAETRIWIHGEWVLNKVEQTEGLLLCFYVLKQICNAAWVPCGALRTTCTKERWGKVWATHEKSVRQVRHKLLELLAGQGDEGDPEFHDEDERSAAGSSEMSDQDRQPPHACIHV